MLGQQPLDSCRPDELPLFGFELLVLYLKNAFHQFTVEQSARFSMADGFLGGLSAQLWPFCRDKQEQKTRLMLLLATIQTDATLPKTEGKKKS